MNEFFVTKNNKQKLFHIQMFLFEIQSSIENFSQWKEFNVNYGSYAPKKGTLPAMPCIIHMLMMVFNLFLIFFIIIIKTWNLYFI